MPINSPATFEMGAGPDLTGTWKNYRTGDVITIRDTLFEDNRLVGVSTGGQMIPYERLQSYVKCDPSEAANKTTLPSRTSKKHCPTTQVKQFVDNLDGDGYGGGFQEVPLEPEVDPLRTPLNKQRTQTAQPKQPEPETPKFDPAITKVLDGLDDNQKPTITVNIKWSEVPEGVIFLKKYLGVETKDLVDACCDRYIKLDEVKRELSEALEKIVTNAIEKPKKTQSKKADVE